MSPETVAHSVRRSRPLPVRPARPAADEPT
jgi:hypothetical protein